MYYVYILACVAKPTRRYVGYTKDLKSRIAIHNAGGNPSTAPFRPWRLENYFAFRSDAKAREFERYLKSGSGRIFARRHFIA